MISLDNSQVKNILPHRSPILLVDSVSELQPGISVKAELKIDPNWDIFRGHFPSDPVLPGVYIAEAMAQTADIMLLSAEENKGKTPLFLGIKQMRFLKQVKPGDTLKISAELTCDAGGGMYDCSVSAFLDEKRAATGQITLALR